MEFSEIRGNCNEVTLFGMNGTASDGLTVWEKEGIIVDKWYKGLVSDISIRYKEW